MCKQDLERARIGPQKPARKGVGRRAGHREAIDREGAVLPGKWDWAPGELPPGPAPPSAQGGLSHRIPGWTNGDLVAPDHRNLQRLYNPPHPTWCQYLGPWP